MGSVGKIGFIKKNIVWLLLNVKNTIINIRLGSKKRNNIDIVSLPLHAWMEVKVILYFKILMMTILFLGTMNFGQHREVYQTNRLSYTIVKRKYNLFLLDMLQYIQVLSQIGGIFPIFT